MRVHRRCSGRWQTENLRELLFRNEGLNQNSVDTLYAGNLGDHCIKISLNWIKNCRRRSIWRDRQTNRQTNRQTRKVIIRVASSSAECANQYELLIKPLYWFAKICQVVVVVLLLSLSVWDVIIYGFSFLVVIFHKFWRLFTTHELLYLPDNKVLCELHRMFLTEQFRLLQQRLEDAIPPAKKAFLQQFYSQVYSNF